MKKVLLCLVLLCSAFSAGAVTYEVKSDVFKCDSNGIQDCTYSLALALELACQVGGDVHFTAGTYRIDQNVQIPECDIAINFDPKAILVGAYVGKIKGVLTNHTNRGQMTWQNYKLKVANNNKYPMGALSGASPDRGGVAVQTTEVIQKPSSTGQAVAGYFGFYNYGGAGNGWAVNTVTNAAAGATGTYFGAEVDLNTSCGSNCDIRGIEVTGFGDVSTRGIAFEAIRADGGAYWKALSVKGCVTCVDIVGKTPNTAISVKDWSGKQNFKVGIDGGVKAARLQVNNVAIVGTNAVGGRCTTVGYIHIVVSGQVKRVPYCN